MNKIAYNKSYGGFSLSVEACKWLLERGSKFVIDYGSDRDLEFRYWLSDNTPRHDPLLIECIETLGEKANGSSSNIGIKNIDGYVYQIEEHDGKETVIEAGSDWICVLP